VLFVALVGFYEKQRLQVLKVNFDLFTVGHLQMKTGFVRKKIIGLALENRVVLEADHHLVRHHAAFS
jgi:hypothetical protein